MDEMTFWSTINQAWETVEDDATLRAALARGTIDDADVDVLAEQAWTEFVPALEAILHDLPADELLAFDRLLERKLYELDRADVQARTDGSDDGFLYARGFIVAMGRAYYDAVNADPAWARPDAECEDVCYLPDRIYREKFGDPPPSDISRESCSNAAGWPDLRR